MTKHLTTRKTAGTPENPAYHKILRLNNTGITMTYDLYVFQ